MDEKLKEMEDAYRKHFVRISEKESEKGCTVEWKELVDSPAVIFHKDCLGG